MKDRYLILVIGILVVIAFIVGYMLPDGMEGQIIIPDSNKSAPIPPDLHEAIVAKVIDGDTVDLQDGQRVRLLGINTPEKGQPYYQEATDRLEELVLEKEELLEMDKSDKGKYDRLLRHIYVDGENVGIILLREGYANVYFVSPDLKYKEEFEAAENYAKENGLCIWTPPNNYTDCIGVLYFRYNAEGDDRYNLNDEYVKFSNSCDLAISMKGWTVKDEATHIYEFPDFVLAAHQMVTLYTGSGIDLDDNLYWGSGGAIWNNDGDTLYMWDSEGRFVLEWEY